MESSSSSSSSSSMKKNLSRKLAEDFLALNMNITTGKSMEYEQLEALLCSFAIRHATKSLLDRFAKLLGPKDDLDHLLKQLNSTKCKGNNKLTRYPGRLFLIAYMILTHPDEVFNRHGDLEKLLTESAEAMIREFELLITTIVDGSRFRNQLNCFDATWCSYLEQFVLWKVKDSKSMEEDLVSKACKLELSTMKTCKVSAAGKESLFSLTHDREAVAEQNIRDQINLREGVRLLSGEAGVERMESALSDIRSKYLEAKEKETRAVVLPGGSWTEKEKELLVNKIIHEKSDEVFKRLEVQNDDKNNELYVKIEKTMKKAFWDIVEESLKQGEPGYAGVVELVKEVRDELCSIAPKWKENISDSIDIDILSQVLTSGSCDLSYLENVLAYALTTLRKLSSLASESEMIKTHKNLMDELSETADPSLVIVKGLRFVLEEIKNLKKEIIEGYKLVIKGALGFEYMRNTFAKRYGSPNNARSSLPVTVEWILSVRSVVDQEWKEYTDSLTAQVLQRHATLRTGRSISGTVTTTNTKDTHQPECSRGDKVDKTVRLGLLKLASGIQGMTPETIPETLELNLSELEKSQKQLQQIIALSTRILVFRQTLLSEKKTPTEDMVSRFVDRLRELLSRAQDDGIKDIVETLEEFVGSENEKCSQVRKEVTANMLVKSLEEDDHVFQMVSRSVYAAARGIMFGGSGLQGREIAERELSKLGASVLTQKLVEVVGDLIQFATVSSNVHRPWYIEITKSS